MQISWLTNWNPPAPSFRRDLFFFNCVKFTYQIDVAYLGWAKVHNVYFSNKPAAKPAPEKSSKRKKESVDDEPPPPKKSMQFCQ